MTHQSSLFAWFATSRYDSHMVMIIILFIADHPTKLHHGVIVNDWNGDFIGTFDNAL